MRKPSKAILHMRRSGIREIFDLANTIPEVIHLEMGEPNFATPAHIRAAATEAAEAGFTKYTPNAGIPELRDALAKKLRERNGIEADPSQVVVTPGGIAALYTTLLSLCNPGDEILVSDPAWPNYEMIGHVQGLEVVRYPLLEEDSLEPSAEVVERHLSSRAKVVVVNSPGNPTGVVADRERLTELVELTRHRGLWLVSDEVYDEMMLDGGVAPSAAAPGAADHVVSVFSFSKTYAMTGWRVGYAVAAADIAELVVRTQEPTTSCVNGPAQYAALAAIEGPQDCVIEMREAYRSRRDRVGSLLTEAGVPHVRPRGAFYVWIDVSGSGLDGTGFARRLLVDHHVAVTPGAAFGIRGERFVRISLATEPDQLIEGVERLVEMSGGAV